MSQPVTPLLPGNNQLNNPTPQPQVLPGVQVLNPILPPSVIATPQNAPNNSANKALPEMVVPKPAVTDDNKKQPLPPVTPTKSKDLLNIPAPKAVIEDVTNKQPAPSKTEQEPSRPVELDLPPVKVPPHLDTNPKKESLKEKIKEDLEELEDKIKDKFSFLSRFHSKKNSNYLSYNNTVPDGVNIIIPMPNNEQNSSQEESNDINKNKALFNEGEKDDDDKASFNGSFNQGKKSIINLVSIGDNKQKNLTSSTNRYKKSLKNKERSLEKPIFRWDAVIKLVENVKRIFHAKTS
jgi:hypothetical protein